MISRIKEQLGPAGFAVAIVALVAALAGGAYAASGGLTSQQKKQVKSIAQTEAKKFATAGPKGDTGAQGATGAKGDTGATGPQGPAGGSGKDGKSVEVGATGPSECGGRGGAKVQVVGEPLTKKEVCNGKDGLSGFTKTLPPKETETGVWRFVSNGEVEQYVPLNFPIPLSKTDAESVTLHVWKEGAASNPAQCTGTPNEPKAEEGSLCLYIAIGEGTGIGTNSGNPEGVYEPDFVGGEGVGQSGAFLYWENVVSGKHASGSFAVTALEQ